MSKEKKIPSLPTEIHSIRGHSWAFSWQQDPRKYQIEMMRDRLTTDQVTLTIQTIRQQGQAIIASESFLHAMPRLHMNPKEIRAVSAEVTESGSERFIIAMACHQNKAEQPKRVIAHVARGTTDTALGQTLLADAQALEVAAKALHKRYKQSQDFIISAPLQTGQTPAGYPFYLQSYEPGYPIYTYPKLFPYTKGKQDTALFFVMTPQLQENWSEDHLEEIEENHYALEEAILSGYAQVFHATRGGIPQRTIFNDGSLIAQQTARGPKVVATSFNGGLSYGTQDDWVRSLWWAQGTPPLGIRPEIWNAHPAEPPYFTDLEKEEVEQIFSDAGKLR